VLASARSHGERRTQTSWHRTRLRVVVPIGIIVAIAIVGVVVAVLGSARRADGVALESERQLFTNALINYGARVLREVESVATPERATRGIRTRFDRDWVDRVVGERLQNFFDHDFIFIADSADRLVYSRPDTGSSAQDKRASAPADLIPILDYVRGRRNGSPEGTVRIAHPEATPDIGPRMRAVLAQKFVGRPALVAAATIGEAGSGPANGAPIVVAVKVFDQAMLEEIGGPLQLSNLRGLEDQPANSEDYVFDVADDGGRSIVRFAWTPKRPGAEIVQIVIPFIAVAIAGFALLAGLVLRHMRRTAAMIAAGETRLRHLALHDPLCGLPNRIFFGERLETVIDQVRLGGPSAAIFYLDLDHFKDVNDTLGHPVGDELIRNVTMRLSRTLRDDDLVARLGGDEFAIITSTATDNVNLHTIAGRIISALCAPYSINGHSIVIGASIGIATIDGRGSGAADIMRYADIALYRAKNEGRNRACIYDAVMDADLSHRKRLENDLRRAIEGENLRLAYQPIVNNSGDTLVGVEALARWTHPKWGEITPAEFIPIAEHSGLIIELGEWVLRRACLDAKGWPGLSIAVNVSPLQFRRADFVDIVERILAETSLDPSRLELEVTESTLLGNVDTAEAAMLRLKALGVRLALDDFGTGYSSLLYLRRFPFDKLKIDSSFVRSIEKAADAAAIVHAVVSLGRGLGMKVTAEGVETAEQHLFLRAAGVHTMQGYRFGRPTSSAEISTRIAAPRSYRLNDSDLAAAAAG
jgi:diguanylate cyclase (GGDEF)-like protein